jgi:hypothetical protein
MTVPVDFQMWLKQELKERIARESYSTGKPDLKIDLHCHDHNSNIPDEALGRILGVPETWLPTERLMSVLKSAGMGACTFTNHNNARSCWELKDKGFDILSGAEFSCHIPDLDVGVHVLTYGFRLSRNPSWQIFTIFLSSQQITICLSFLHTRSISMRQMAFLHLKNMRRFFCSSIILR